MSASLTQPADLVTNSASAGAAHAPTHQHGGNDEVASATAGANVIPKAGAGSTLAIGFIPLGSSASTVCVGNDARLSDSRTPTAHAASHLTGAGDPIALVTGSVNGLARATDNAKLATIQGGGGTLVGGTATITTATISGSSSILVTRNTNGGTVGAQLAVPSSGRIAGSPGSSAFVVNALDASGAAVATDTSTFDYLIIN